MRVKYRCPGCNKPVLAARWEGGREYCTSKDCIDRFALVNAAIMYEHPPKAGEIDIDPMELDDIAAMYEYDSE